MGVRTRAIDVGTDRGRWLLANLAREIDESRLDRGLTYAALGRDVGLTGQQVARICQGRSPNASVAMLARLAALVGLELAARCYPGGQPLRDGAQQALLGRLRSRIGNGVRWQFEVPVLSVAATGRRDARAWDAVLSAAGWRAAVEAETNVRDVQALLRRLALKQRDGDVDGGVLLVLNDSRHHRTLVNLAGGQLRELFPVDARRALARLRRGESPGNAIVLV